MAEVEFSCDLSRGYNLYLADYSVKKVSSFKGKHEFEISAKKKNDWSLKLRCLIQHVPQYGMAAGMFMPFSGRKVTVRIEQIPAVIKTLVAVDEVYRSGF